MYKHIVIILMLAVSNASHAQVITNFRRVASQFYAKGDYYSAVQYYEKYLDGQTPPNSNYEPYMVQKQGTGLKSSAERGILEAELVYRMADSYRHLNDHVKAEQWFKVLMDNFSGKYPQAKLWYATTLRFNGNYTGAQQELEKFIQEYPVNDQYSKEAQEELDNCLFIQQQIDFTTTGIVVQKLNKTINKEGANYAAAWLNTSTLVFTSTRPDPFEVSYKPTFTNTLYTAKMSGESFDDVEKMRVAQVKDRQQSAPCFSPDGTKMYFTGWSYNKDGKKVSAIYLSELNNGDWTEPVLVDGNTNGAGYNCRQPHVTADGRYLLFASDRTGGLGGYDIWYATLNTRGFPINVYNPGAAVNTKEDEESPFYHEGSNTLVFASKGRIGMGGFDLFASTGHFNDDWTEAVNMGHPVNSIKDDSYYVGRGKYLLEDALVSSDRSSNCCLELYSVHKSYKQYFNGEVVDCQTKMPLLGVSIVITNGRGKTLSRQTTKEDGKFVLETETGATLEISGVLPGYEPTQLNIPAVGGDDIFANVLCLTKVEDLFKDREIFATRDIRFEEGKASMIPTSYAFLDKVVAYLKEHPAARIEVGVHTDSTGSAEAGLQLSKQRAESCINYFVNSGLPRDQVTGKGYGLCCPVPRQPVPEGTEPPTSAELDSRVEFRLLRQ